MRGRIWILLGLAALAVLTSSAPVFRDSFQETHSTTFGGELQHRYPGWTGFNTCVPTAVQGQLDCWGEIHRGSQYRIVESREGIFQAGEPWTRAVQPVPTQSLRTFGASGTAITNNPRVDWGLVTGGFLGKSLPLGVSSVNGDSSSMPPANLQLRLPGLRQGRHLPEPGRRLHALHARAERGARLAPGAPFGLSA